MATQLKALCSFHRGLPHSLDLCVPKPWPSFASRCLTRYGVVPTDLVGLTSPPPVKFTNKSYLLEKLLALPMATPHFESTVRIPRVAALGLATTEAYYEDPSWLVRSANLEGVWDPAPVGSDHLGLAPPNLYAVLDEALTKAWHWFVEGRAHRAKDVAMAVWACLFNDGQAMAHSDQDYLIRVMVRTVALCLVSRGPWKDAMKWLNAAHSVGIPDLDEVVVEVALWNFRSRHSLDPEHSLFSVLNKWETPGHHVEALKYQVLHKWSVEKGLLGKGVTIGYLPHPECLHLCGLYGVQHGPKWAYPRQRCLSPSTAWVYPNDGPLDPPTELLDGADFSDLEVLDREGY